MTPSMFRVTYVALVVALSLISSPAQADSVDEALESGSKALVGRDMALALQYFNEALAMEKRTRLQTATIYSGLCAAHYKQSMITENSATTRKAIADCSRAVTLKSDFQSVYRMRGIAYLTLGSFEQSVEDLTVAVVLDPEDHLSFQNRGLANARLGKFQEALSDFDRAIKLKPDHPWGYYNRGRLYATFHQYDKAVEDFSTFIRFKQQFDPVYLHRGRSRMRLGRYQQAVGDFYEAIRLKGEKNIPALAERGVTLYLLGRYEESVQDLESVRQLAPNDIVNRLWFFLAKQRLKQPSQEMLQQNGKPMPSHTWPGVLASHFLGQAESQKALDLVRQTQDPIKRVEQESLTLFLLGEWASVRGLPEMADKWFHILVNKAGPRPPWYHAASYRVRPSGETDAHLSPPAVKSDSPPPPVPHSAAQMEEAIEEEYHATALDVPNWPSRRVESPSLPQEIISPRSSMALSLPKQMPVSVDPVTVPVIPSEVQPPAAPVTELAQTSELPSKTPIIRGRNPHKPGSYAFKMASFTDTENADKALVEVTGLGYPVYVQEMFVKQTRFLRVWVGPFKTEKEAVEAWARITKIDGRNPSKVRLR